MPSEEMDIGYIVGVVQRRFWQMVIPFVVLFCIISTVVMLLPAKYQSSATILIEGQEVPQELVRSTVTGFVEERLQAIMQVVLNRTNLMSIIDRVGLYKDERKTMTSEALVEMMRENISMTPIKADVASNTGRPATATIAFSIAFEGKNPTQVLQTTNTLVSLFLEENLSAPIVRSRRWKSISGGFWSAGLFWKVSLPPSRSSELWLPQMVRMCWRRQKSYGLCRPAMLLSAQHIRKSIRTSSNYVSRLPPWKDRAEIWTWRRTCKRNAPGLRR